MNEEMELECTPQKIVSSGVKSQDLGGQYTGPKREIRRSPNVSFNKSIVARAVTCCAVLLEPQLLDIMIVQFRMKKLVIMALHRYHVVAFVVFEEGFHQPINAPNSCQVIYSQFGLSIHQNDHQARRRFVEWAQNEIAVVPDFYKRILFSDEAHFWLNGYDNKQNCCIWSEANPQVYVETPLHPEKLIVWCALWAGGIIGPYFFKNDEGHNVTINGDWYRVMITNFFIPELNNQDVQELWFRQDGATCHTARATIDLLKDTFGDRLISRFGPVNWPPRSCDLSPLDYFL
ncbi:uncharacterized protein TNCV_2098541 [Trichonephila clavipes]|nr:uncharacterized protein TNCV_2098541 [Trichonephila clavipes]